MRDSVDCTRKLVMKCILEAKGTAIFQFIHGPRGSLSVTSKVEPVQLGCCNHEALPSGHYLISTSSIASRLGPSIMTARVSPNL